MFKIVRYYYIGSRKRTIRKNLTEAQAQEWCNNPETSSKTAKSPQSRRITRRNGPWFDGYEEQ